MKGKAQSKSVALGLAFLLTQTTGYAESLKSAAQQTVITHPQILEDEYNRHAVGQTVRQAIGEYLPSVDILAGSGREYSDNPATRGAGKGTTAFTRNEGAARLRQLIFDGGAVTHRIDSAHYNVNEADQIIDESEQRLAFEAANSYINVLRRKELVGIRKKSVQAHREIGAKVKERFESGAGRKSEVKLVAARQALAQSQLEEQVGLQKNARDNYKAVVGHLPTGGMNLPALPKNIPHTLQAAVKESLIHNPAIEGAKQASLSSAENVKITQADFYPNFYLDLEYGYDNNLDGVKGHNEETLAMVRMEYNILRGGIDVARVKESKARLTAAQFNQDKVQREVVEDTEVSWNNLKTTQRRLYSLKIHRDESLNVYIAYLKQFELGQRTLFDLLNAQVEYYNASASYADARYDLHRDTYRLLASMGTLSKILGIDGKRVSPRNIRKTHKQELAYNYPDPSREK